MLAIVHLLATYVANLFKSHRDILVAACGRLCLHRKRINISSVLAGQKLGIREVDDGIWLVSFMHYDFGYFDLEQKTLQPLQTRRLISRSP